MKVKDLPYLLDDLDGFINSFQGRKPVLFLDYDGTLTPIVENPEDAVISPEMKKAVDRLSGLIPVYIVSGRDLQDVKKLVGLNDLIYAGSHGFDIEGPDGFKKQHPDAVNCLPQFDHTEKVLREKLNEIQGAKVERKLFAIAVHYRQVKEAEVEKVENLVKTIHQEEDCFKLAGGKKIFELKPNLEWNKGYAVLWLLEKLHGQDENVVPIYFGDDLTDEDAFEALKKVDGFGVLVGDHESDTESSFYLEEPSEVQTVFTQLIKFLEKIH